MLYIPDELHLQIMIMVWWEQNIICHFTKAMRLLHLNDENTNFCDKQSTCENFIRSLERRLKKYL